MSEDVPETERAASLRFAAIDVGSNAIRLLLKRVIENGERALFKKESLVRIPLRLGEDSFRTGRISDEKRQALINTMRGFHYLMQAYEPLGIMACATSAMREAENGDEIVRDIKEQTGIELKIIDGPAEAEIICRTSSHQLMVSSGAYLFIDVGGGSTEITLLVDQQPVNAHSFDIGTVRILHDQVTEEAWKELKDWLKTVTAKYDGKLTGIGSGGNINKIFRLASIKNSKPITLKQIKQIHNEVSALSLKERISELRLRPDRADTIVPAGKIFLWVMKWAKMKQMIVPQIGLADGLIHIMYDWYRDQHQSLAQ
ncbi:exopolyphosphatase [candidate division GN15 bacterium]|nr:exopolyphosphatase [candidate division GN15 bacterium]